MTDSSAPFMRPYGRQLLICTNGDCADPEAGERLQQRFRELAQAHGLSKLRNLQRVKCTLTGCLGVCGGGPILVVYPEGIWYHHVDAAALERIFHEHLLNDHPVEELIFHRIGAGSPAGTEAGAAAAYTPDHSGDVEVATADTPASPPTRADSTPEAEARRKAARQARKHKGLVIVNTGNGKGKTTAALGILMRARGRKLRLGGIQFFKHATANFGELRTARELGIELTPMGDGFTWTSRDMDETQAKALHGWETAQKKIASGDYDIFLMDEFTYVLHFDWLNTHEVINWLRENKPPALHLVITGRDAPQELIDYADLVTEMKAIKHPFDSGIKAQPGIEF
jgi:cob(I)alamin adenosyltransferase